jgi:hypothetical protein
VALDECHRAKKYSPLQFKSTIAGNKVVELQDFLPRARILYASATGAWQPEHLAYMQRLGLWENEAFISSTQFVTAMAGRLVYLYIRG